MSSTKSSSSSGSMSMASPKSARKASCQTRSCTGPGLMSPLYSVLAPEPRACLSNNQLATNFEKEPNLWSQSKEASNQRANSISFSWMRKTGKNSQSTLGSLCMRHSMSSRLMKSFFSNHNKNQTPNLLTVVFSFQILIRTTLGHHHITNPRFWLHQRK